MPAIHTVDASDRVVGRRGLSPVRSRWPCGRSTARSLAAVTSVVAVGGRRREHGPSPSVSTSVQPSSRPSGVELVVGRAVAQARAAARRTASGRRRVGPPSVGGRRRARSAPTRGGVGQRRAPAQRASSVGRRRGVVGDGRCPRSRCRRSRPGPASIGAVLQRRRGCARAAAARPAGRRRRARASARRRPVAPGELEGVGAQPSARAEASRPEPRRRAGHVLPHGERDAVAGHVDRGEVEVLADVVLVGPHRAEGARATSWVCRRGRRSTGSAPVLVTRTCQNHAGWRSSPSRSDAETAGPPTCRSATGPAAVRATGAGRVCPSREMYVTQSVVAARSHERRPGRPPARSRGTAAG